MPGVLVIEAMAQQAALFCSALIDDPHNKVLLFTGIDKAKFRRPVVPGDTLRIQMTLLRFNGRLCRLHGEAFVEGKLVAEAVVTSVLVIGVRSSQHAPDFARWEEFLAQLRCLRMFRMTTASATSFPSTKRFSMQTAEPSVEA